MIHSDVQAVCGGERGQSALAIFAILFLTIATVLLLAFGYIPPDKLVLGGLAIGGSALLLRYPEMALAGLLMIGTLKGNPAIADSPIDVTVALGALVIAGCLLHRWKDLLDFRIDYPRAYLWYVPFLGIMLLSLTYTPNFAAGVDKIGRFLAFSGLAIFAPFLVFKTKASLWRFFVTLSALGLVVALDSFSSLGGAERLVSTGGDTIQLGHDAALAIVVIWYVLLPGKSLLWRVALYGIVMTLCVAVIGAGSRGPVVALTCCILFSLVAHEKLGMKVKSVLIDLALLVAMGLAIIPTVGIPQSSYDYLARLGDPNVHHMLGPREALMDLGWRLTFAHPLTGVGIGGYPVLFRGIGAWPHNVLLEISSEMGVINALVFCCIVFVAVREGLRQLRRFDSAYNTLDAMVFAFLMFELIDSMNTGSINDNRGMWLAMALPFVLRNLRARSSSRSWLRAKTAPARSSHPPSGMKDRLALATQPF